MSETKETLYYHGIPIVYDDSFSFSCANCQKLADMRAGWSVTGQGWQEADYCKACLAATWEKAKNAVAMTFGPVGVSIWRNEAKV